MKLFADFYQSDIIVASPLGLVTKKAEGEEDAVQDLDFLSSIDIVLAARCDVFQMQNWAHVAAGKFIQCIRLLNLVSLELAIPAQIVGELWARWLWSQGLGEFQNMAVTTREDTDLLGKWSMPHAHCQACGQKQASTVNELFQETWTEHLQFHQDISEIPIKFSHHM